MRLRRSCSSRRDRPGTCLRAAHPALADLSRRARARRERRHRAAAAGAGALRLVGARLGPLVLRARRRRALRPRRLQRHGAVRPLRPARRVTAMAGVAIPERIVEGEAMRVEAEDNAHVLIDFGDARFASVTTGFTMQSTAPGDRAVWHRRRAAAARRRLGARGLRALAQRARRVGAVPESDPGWQWTEGLRHLVDCIETRPRARDPARARVITRSRSCWPRRRRPLTAARARSRSDFPRPTSRRSRTPADGRRIHDPRSALI